MLFKLIKLYFNNVFAGSVVVFPVWPVSRSIIPSLPPFQNGGNKS